MRQMVVGISHSKVRNLSKMDRFSASLSHRYDITDAILKDNENVEVQYLRSLLFNLFDVLQAVRT